MNLSLLKQYFVAIGTATILLGACTKSNTDRIATVKIEEKHIVKKENAILKTTVKNKKFDCEVQQGY